MSTLRFSLLFVMPVAALAYACSDGNSNRGTEVGSYSSTASVQQSAADACVGVASGAACTFEGHHGQNKTGSCQAAPDGGGLVCVADHHGFGTSQAAIDACASLASGAACTFTGHHDRMLNGTCAAGADASAPLACKPDPSQFGPPQAAIDACASLAASAACTFSGREGQEVTGTCQQKPGDDTTLVCLPAGFHHGHHHPRE